MPAKSIDYPRRINSHNYSLPFCAKLPFVICPGSGISRCSTYLDTFLGKVQKSPKRKTFFRLDCVDSSRRWKPGNWWSNLVGPMRNRQNALMNHYATTSLLHWRNKMFIFHRGSFSSCGFSSNDFEEWLQLHHRETSFCIRQSHFRLGIGFCAKEIHKRTSHSRCRPRIAIIKLFVSCASQ